MARRLTDTSAASSLLQMRGSQYKERSKAVGENVLDWARRYFLASERR